MNEHARKTKAQLIAELECLELRLAELEANPSSQKTASPALRASEERYRRMVEAVTDYVFVVSVEDGKAGETVHGSACVAVTGYTSEEFREAPHLWIQIVHEEDRETVRAHAARVMAGQSADPLEHRIWRKDGALRWVCNTPVPHWNGQGCLVSYDGLIRDVTERKRAEEELRRSHELMGRIIEGSPIPTFVISTEHEVVFWNDALAKLSGLAAATMIGTREQWRAFYDKKRPCMADLLLEGTDDAIPQWYAGKYAVSDLVEGAYEATDFFPALGGAGRWLRFTAAALKSTSGEIVCAIETLEDVTDRKRAEEGLRQSQYLMGRIIDGSPIPTFVISTEHEVVLWNDALAKLSGLAAATMIGTREQWRAFYDKERPCMADLLLEGTDDARRQWYAGKCAVSDLVEGAYEATDFFPAIGDEGRWLRFTAAALKSTSGEVVGAIETLEDVTDRKRAEDALRESEEKYRGLIETTDTGYVIVDSQGRVLDANPKYVSMAGYDCLEEIRNHLLLEWTAEHTKTRNSEAIEQCMAQGFIRNLEVEYVHKDGTCVPIEVNATVVRRDIGTTILSLCRDITERKRAQAELQFRNILLSTQQEASIDGILVVDEKARILSYNRRFVEMWNLPANLVEDRVDEPVLQFVTAQIADPLSFLQRVQNLYEHKQETSRGELILADGRVFDRYSAPMFGPDDQYYGRVWYFRDITERKRAEEAKRLSEWHTAILNEIAHVFLSVPDNEMYGEVLAILLRVTNSPYGIFGFIEENGDLAIPSLTRDVWQGCQVTGKSLVFPPDTWGDNLWGRAIRERRALYAAGPFHTPEGHIAIDAFLAAPIVFGDQAIGLLSVANREGGYGEEEKDFLERIALYVAPILRARMQRDRQERGRRQAEEQLRQAQKMESVGRLAGGVAHDFNNLLTSILGNAELALMGLDPDDRARVHLNEVTKAGESAAALTQQLLAFSRKQVIEPRIINLDDVVANVHKMLVRLIGEDIDLRSVRSGSLWEINADPGQIEQILINLAVNARDAMPDGGKLTIETENVVLDASYHERHPLTEPGDYVMLAVSDTGHGMSDEVKQHLFEPFFTTKPVGAGTGLGLATVHGVMKQNRGGVEVYSEVGMGTTFKLYFPRAVGVVAEPPDTAAHPTSPGGSATVFLVEDDPQVRTLALHLLQKLGYRALAYPNGDEALRAIQAHEGEIHLVITDVVMPGMSGPALAAELQKVRPGIKVLFASGYTEDVIVHQGVLDQGIHFIGKPYRMEQFARKIREELGDH